MQTRVKPLILLILLVVILAMILLRQASAEDDMTVPEYISWIYYRGVNDAYNHIRTLCEEAGEFSFEGETYYCGRKIST